MTTLCFTCPSLCAAELQPLCHHRLAFKLLAGQFVQPLIHKEHRGLEEPRGEALLPPHYPTLPPMHPPPPRAWTVCSQGWPRTRNTHCTRAVVAVVRTLTRARGRASWSSWEAAWALCPEARSACSSGDGGGGGGRAPRTTRTAELEGEKKE